MTDGRNDEMTRQIRYNYAEICRVGKLEANFQQVPLVQIF